MPKKSTIKSKIKRPARKLVVTKDKKQKVSSKTGKYVDYNALVSLDGKVKHLVPTNDSFSNLWANLGLGSDSLLQKTEYPLTRRTNDFNLMTSLYRGNWLVQNIVRMVPEDICKNWFKLKGKLEKDEADAWTMMERTTQIKKRMIDGLSWGRLYGGAIGIILIEGQQEDLDKPLKLDEIALNSFKGLYIVDRWTSVTPSIKLTDDITNENFGLPESYNVNDSSGNVIANIHNTRIVRFIGRELPAYEKIANEYWGESEIEAVYNEIVKRDNTSENIANLVFKANLSVQEIENLNQIFAVGGTQAQKRFWDVIQAQAILESNFGIKAIEKGEGYRHEQYNFAGLPDVYNSIMMDVSGATHIPVTKLFGRSPAGLNATGESDMQNYYEFLEKTRSESVDPIINKLLPIMQMSCFGTVKQDVSYEWEPLKAQDDLEKAQLSGQYSQEVIGAYQAGIITQKAALKELSSLSEKYNVFTNITDEDIDRAKDKTINELQQMQDPMAGLTGDYLESGQEPNTEISEEQTEDTDAESKSTQEEIISKLDNTIKELNSNKSDVIEADSDYNEYNGEITEQVVERYERPSISSGLTISNIPIQKPEVVEKKTDYLKEPQKESNLLKAINNLVKYLRGE